MSDKQLIDENFLDHKRGKAIQKIHYDAKKFRKLTILDFTKELLEKNDKHGVSLKQDEVNWFFEGNVMSVWADHNARRQQLLRQTRCPVIMDFWTGRKRQPRNIRSDPSLFQLQPRQGDTEDGRLTRMTRGRDILTIKDVGLWPLERVSCELFMKWVHEPPSGVGIAQDTMKVFWSSVVFNLYWYECDCFKAKKLYEWEQYSSRLYREPISIDIQAPPGKSEPQQQLTQTIEPFNTTLPPTLAPHLQSLQFLPGSSGQPVLNDPANLMLGHQPLQPMQMAGQMPYQQHESSWPPGDQRAAYFGDSFIPMNAPYNGYSDSLPFSSHQPAPFQSLDMPHQLPSLNVPSLSAPPMPWNYEPPNWENTWSQNLSRGQGR